MIWSIMPEEILFAATPSKMAPRVVLYNGRQLIVDAAGGSEGRIVRLLSTDPGDFLLAEFAPGRTVSLNNK